MFHDSKSIFASKTVWGGGAALIAGALGIFGYSVSPADQATIVRLALDVVAALGGAGAVFGRIKASKRIR